MRDEFISVSAHLVNVLLEETVSQLQVVKQAREEQFLICYHLSPIVLGTPIAEDLAPFEDGDIQEIVVCRNPKLLRCPALPGIVGGTKESQVPQAMKA